MFLDTSAGLPVSSVISASYSAVGKFVLAALPPLLIAALSNARAASSSVSWSPSETVRPRADIWFIHKTNYFSTRQMTALLSTCISLRQCRKRQRLRTQTVGKQILNLATFQVCVRPKTAVEKTLSHALATSPELSTCRLAEIGLRLGKDWTLPFSTVRCSPTKSWCCRGSGKRP